ncbi:hypothetical protein [Sediminibacterium sp.]|jgi:hypothetical protein|uniref:hypothetical protein n=1 Tax=Sediminibacterium sp. TaxID=1917865 RepID=UPI000BD72EC5|nr:hypothetical protein [Sediminibacterium sp.]OYY09695.1 MAG: hypothetical protein B7Y66_07965 [Sphingobacteriia bacterium 35-36-14]OYZ54617.1 MAG: hypothetical protein B7Y11_04690 [Sphingobacteriia bacterium 24-36-13]OZA63654.1 MAG: hypothetical protein B7X68_10020 [Sphingobacteriia bacterium 39-36-14]MDO8996279.1 hypothetical protein [Sediminibacterium sp.]MDP2420019.1 hypothetical protein [Sediminibacterium sp.]
MKRNNYRKTNVIWVHRIILLTVAVWLFTISCHTSYKSQVQTLQQVPDELLGTFKDDYGSIYHTSNKEWLHGAGTKYHLLMYNKEDNYFIAQNDKANPSDGGLYSRIDIMYFENMQPWKWGYCLTAYKAATMQKAINTAAADRVNPRKGCNGYPFSRMKRE